jgi:hypothetical protein
MLQIFAILALVLASAFLFYKAKTHTGGVGKVKKIFIQLAGGFLAVLALVIFVGMSIVYVGKDEIVILDKVYFGKSMPTGQIVAKADQNGPQAKVLNPGFKFIPFVRFEYDLDTASTITIPPNRYGIITAKDGKPLRENQVIADEWDNYNDMIDAEKFLEKGQKGMQLTVLPPGNYRINPYLFTVELGSALQVKTGEVAVIRANVQTAENCKVRKQVEGLTTALVPKGCIGVWDEPLYQGMYYLNVNAYKPTIISTRAQVWSYKGGYTTKKINLTVNNDGSITQATEPVQVIKPEDAADNAINVRVEGWTVPVEARVTVQVAPENAPIVVAGVGTLQNVEDKITTPNIRDSLRTIGGREEQGCKTVDKVRECEVEAAKALDFVTKRAKISKEVMVDIRPTTENAGVTILDVNLGEPAIPPELLVANQRKQIAEQLENTYTAEKRAQELRISVENERATANQQEVLVKAEIAEEASIKYMQQRANQGKGEQKYLTSLAKGEKARKEVLGEDNVVMLKALEIVSENPSIVKVPENLTVVGTGASGLGELGALLGRHSNIAKSIPTMQPAGK